MSKFDDLLKRCEDLEPIPTAVAHPCEATALAGAIEAAEKGLIKPILVGPAAKIRAIAKETKVKLGDVEIIDAAHSHESAAQAVQLVRRHEDHTPRPRFPCDAVLKGFDRSRLHDHELFVGVAMRRMR